MVYKHYFRCAACGYHVTYLTEDATPVQPGRTHADALKNGGVKMGINDPAAPGCLGALSYCSGMDPKTLKPCPTGHRGTEQIADPPPPTPNPDWTEFSNRVHAAWQLYVNSGYNMTHRGPNHDRAHRTANGVRTVLQNCGGVVTIHGAVYTVSNSLTTDASLKRNAAGHATFIYHL